MNTPYRIESGIEVPPKRRLGDEVRKYPFGQMKVGDSFFIAETDPEKAVKVRSAITSAASWFSKRNARTCFTVRQIWDGKQVQGVRVWRISHKQ